jgi:hypothetical protein
MKHCSTKCRGVSSFYQYRYWIYMQSQSHVDGRFGITAGAGIAPAVGTMLLAFASPSANRLALVEVASPTAGPWRPKRSQSTVRAHRLQNSAIALAIWSGQSSWMA